MGNCKSKNAPRHVAHAQEYSRAADEVPKVGPLDLTAHQVAALKAAGFKGTAQYEVSSHAASSSPANGVRAGSSANSPAGDRQLVFVLGGPGSGKGTQCEKLRERFGFVHLSVGDLLRAEAAKPDSPLGKQLQDAMREGRLVPDDITISLLKHAVAQTPPGAVILLDGFPRSLHQAQQAEAALGRPLAVLYFDCSEATMKTRLLGHAKTSGRVDDNEEAVAKRLRTFEQETLPVRKYYEEHGMLRVVDAEPPSEQVFEKVCRLVDELTAAAGMQQPSQPQADEQPPQSVTMAGAAAAEAAEAAAAAAGSEADAEASAALAAISSDVHQQPAEPAAATDAADAAPDTSHEANIVGRQHQEQEEEEQTERDSEKDTTAAVATDAEAAAAGEPLGGVGGDEGARQQEAADAVEAEAAAAGGSAGPGTAAVGAPILANTAAASKSARAAAAHKSLKGAQAAAKGGRRTTGPRISGGPRVSGSPRSSGGPRVSGGARSVSPAKRRTSSRAPVAAFPGVSSGGDAGGSGSKSVRAAAAEGQRTADEASLLLGDEDVQPAHEQEPPPQVVLPPVLLLPDRDDDEMMADAKRIAAEAMGLRQPQPEADRSLQGRGTRTGSKKAPAAAAGKRQPFSWIYGDDDEIAAEAAKMLQPLPRPTGDAAALKAFT